MAPLVIGMRLTLGVLMGGPLTGASLNPGRTLGPTGVAATTSTSGLFLVGLTVGGVLAVLLRTGLFKKDR